MRRITCSRDAWELLKNIWSSQMEHVEEFVILCLNRSNRVLGYSLIGRGGLSGTVADPKVIFQVALKANASSIIIAHNHPSGEVNPSSADEAITKRIKKVGEFLDLPLLDHLIISNESYYSFADEKNL